MATTTTKTNKPILPRGADNRPVDSYNRAELYSGKALDFDGVNDYVEVGSITDTYKSFCLYFKPDADIRSGTSYQRLFGIYEQYFGVSTGSATGITTGETLIFMPTGGGRFGTTMEFVADTWYHVAVVAKESDNTYLMYINAQDKTDLVVGTHTPAAATKIRLAWDAQGTGAKFDGQIANFKAFSEVLTAAQVADLYNNPEKVVPTGVENTALKLWLPMQEGAGTTAYDGSGNGNHGTISGATYTHGIGAPVSQTAVIDWNKPYYFDGVDDSFTTGTYQALGDRTITLSFYSSDYSTTGSYPNTLFAFNTASGGNTDIVRITADGYVAVYNGGAKLGTPTIQVNENELTHIAIVTDAGTETKVYVNGELSYSYNAWSPSVGSTDIFNIGQETDGVNISDLWRGFIFNVGVFDSVLTQSEIQAIQGKRYADLTSAQKTNLVSFYSLQNDLNDLHGSKNLTSTGNPSALLIPQGLTSGRDLLGNLFENVRKQGALNLDGNSWAEVHDNASVDLTDAITLEAWVYWDGTASDDGILGRWGDSSGAKNYMLYAASNTRVDFYINNSDSRFEGIATGWRHIVGTYDKSNRKLYVDGVLRDTDAMTDAITTSDKPIEIGRYRHGAGTRLYTNDIAQPRIYNRALTAEEVLQNYNATKDLYI